VALHLVLAAAAMLVGWPASMKALAVLALVVHGVVRRPLASPAELVVTEDGCCAVPEWNTGRRPFGSRSMMCPFWIRLDLGKGTKRRDILLVADQIAPEEWRRLRALVRRARRDE
jgi:hypothetical protein